MSIMIDKHNKFEIPVSDWASQREKAPSIQGYKMERNIIKFLKERISHSDLREIKQTAFPSLSRRINSIISVEDFMIEVEMALQNVKASTLERIWERLSKGMSRTDLIKNKSSVTNNELKYELVAIFKASFRKDEQDV